MNGKLDYRLTLDESDYVSGIRRANDQLINFRRSKQQFGGETQRFGGGMASMAKGAAVATAAYVALRAAVEGARASYLQFAQTDRLERALAATMGSASLARARLVTLRDVAKSPGLGLEEAAQGDIRLQAVGYSAMRAERILRQVGNALASAGAGKAELDGVIVALSQMAAKGVISAEEINQIAERMPQIRKAMKEAFGTADTEALQRMKLGVDDFVDGVMDQLAKLPRASGGAANSIENLEDAWKSLKTSIGKGLDPLITPSLQGMAKGVDNLAAGIRGDTIEGNVAMKREAARHAREQQDAAEAAAAAEREVAKSIQLANMEAARQVSMQKAAAEYAERQAAAAKETRDAAMAQGTAATRRIIELTTPEPALIERDLKAAMDKAFSMSQLVNFQSTGIKRDGFSIQDLEAAQAAEQDLTKKAAMRALLAEILSLQKRQKEVAKEAADEAARAAENAEREAKAAADLATDRARAADGFEAEGRILAARAAGNQKLVEQLEREERVRRLTLDLMQQQGMAEEEARRAAADRVALEDRAAGGRPRRGLRNAEDSARARFDRMSARDRERAGGSFDGFLDRDRTTRNSLAYRARMSARAAEFGTPGRPDGKKDGSKLETLAQAQKTTLESIDKRLAELGKAGP